MRNTMMNYIRQFNVKRLKQRKLVNIFLLLACIVSIGVFWRLKLNGVAMTGDVTCSIEEHVHTDACYERRLICGKEESGEHKHTDACYETVLICGKQEHRHDIRCMSDKTADVENEKDWLKTIPAFKETDSWADKLVSVASSQLQYKESDDNYELNEDLTKRGYTRYGEWFGNPYEDWNTVFAAFCLNYAGIPAEALPYKDNCSDWITALKEQKLYTMTDGYVPKSGDLIFMDQREAGNMDADSEPVYRVGIISQVNKDKDGVVTDLRVIEGDANNVVAEKPYKPTEMVLGYVSTERVYAAYNGLEGTDETTVQEAAEGTAENPAEAVVENPTEGTTENPTEAVVENPAEGAMENPAEAVVEDPAGETAENPTEAAAEDPAGENAENPAEAIAENTETAPEEVQTQEASEGDFTVSVAYTEKAGLPQEAELKVTQIDPESELFKKYCEEHNTQYDWMIDVGFYVGDEEVEPEDAVDVKIVMPDLQQDQTDVTVITHISETDTEVFTEDEGTLQTEEVSDELRSAEFKLNSFSLIAGQTYHTAKVVNELQNGKKYLVYTVIGDQVYLMNHYGGYGVAKINLSDFNGDNSNCTAANNTVYWNDDWVTDDIDTAEGIKWTAERKQVGSAIEWEIKNCWGSYLDCKSDYWWKHGEATTGDWNDLKVYGNGAAKVIGQQKWNGFWRLDFIANTDGAGYRWVTTRTDNPQSANPSVKIYFAEIQVDYTKPGSQSGGGSGNTGSDGRTFPASPITGQYTEKNMYFFNVEYKDGTLKGVPNVTYTIYDNSGNAVTSFTTTANRQVNDIEAMVGKELKTGQTYIMKQTATSDEFLLNTETWKFTVNGSTLELEQQSDKKTTGIIFNYRKSDIEYDKTAEVVDYANRTYKVDLSAKANQYKYDIDPKKIYMVVDQSNSMLFPSEMTPVTGAELKVKRDRYWDNWQNKWVYYFEETNKNTYSVDYDALENLRRNGTLQEGVLYYFIANETTSSTAYALWYDGQQWFYQDASYYAKAKWNPDGTDDRYINTDDHTRFPARNAGYTGNVDDQNKVTWGTNGGSLDQNGAHKIYRGIGDDSKLVSGNDPKYGGDISYQIYIAPGTYNRLHYLEDSMISLLQALAALNPNNEVTLETFTSSVNSCQTETLSKTGLNNLINSVGNITTLGGTRQDYALAHLNGNKPITVNGKSTDYTQNGTANHTKNHLSANKDDNIVILITDGAPNASGSEGTIPNAMSNTYDGNSTIVYKAAWEQARDIRDKATLVTIGLGMGNVETGKKLLKGIATDGSSDQPDSASGTGNWYIPEDSSQLNEILIENIMKKMIRKTPVEETRGKVTDNISDTFVPIDPETSKPVTSGTWINLSGQVVAAAAAEAAGQVIHDESGWRVDWKESVISQKQTTEDIINVKIKLGRQNYDDNIVEDIAVKKGTKVLLTFDSSQTPVVQTYINRGGWNWERKDIAPTSVNGTKRVYEITVDEAMDISTISYGTSSYTLQVPDTGSSDGWHGTVYLKAKEEFIGGNTIETNKSATLLINDSALLIYPKPNVNVRLLDLNQNNSFETVFLGDSVTPQNAVDALRNLIEFTKIVDAGANSTVGGSADYSGSAGAGTGWITSSDLKMKLANLPKVDGSGAGVGLTEADLTSLVNGNEVKKIYTYSDADGPVGEFTYKLTKTSEVPEPASLAAHVTVKVGDKVETYTLTVDYEPYHLNIRGDNVHNGDNGPGTEVDGDGNSMKLKSTNEHHVNVIAGAVKLKKILDVTAAPTTEQSFTLRLCKATASDGNGVSDTDYIDVVFKVAAGSTDVTLDSYTAYGAFETKETIFGNISVDNKDETCWKISGLPRGYFVVSEVVGADDDYVPTSVAVVEVTNCFSKKVDNTIVFGMGYAEDHKDVITDSSYKYGEIDLPNTTNLAQIQHGILGTAEIKNGKSQRNQIEVQKIWDDVDPDKVDQKHKNDVIYLVLYNGTSPVTDASGHALAAKLDSSNKWEASFEIMAENVDAYSIREIAGEVANKETDKAKTSAIVVNSSDPETSANVGDTIIYYESVAEEGGRVTIGGNEYQVQYGTMQTETGSRVHTISVTNAKAYELPETGGMGTGWYTAGGSVLMLLALCGIGLRQRKEKGGDC